LKKLLIVVSVYRQGERIHPIIPSLSNDFDLSLLSVHQMNYRQQWNGSIDMRDEFHKRYDSYFEHIHNDWTKVDYSKYDAILFDDCRDKGHEIPTMIIYSIAKQNNIKVFANQHGNRDFTNKSFEINHYKKVFDYCFLFGKFQKDKFSKFINKDAFLLGGIPSNDNLKNYERTNENILVITNFLENERRVFPNVFGDKFVKQIKLNDLQQKYGKKVVVKIKNRDRHFALGNPYNQDIDFVKSVLKNNSIDGDVIQDIEDDNLMVSQAHSVIGISSTLCFKPIQMGIPTVVLDGGNFIGSFENFIGFCKLNEVHEKIETQLKTGRDTSYIENILEGGVDYNSIEKYTSEIKRIVNG
tara:strand:+ start:1232 stop:2296 length:1065 start_codon:yes stop_codon:yes gene_type:complete